LNFLKWTEPVAMALAFIESEPLAMHIVKLSLKVDPLLGARLAGEVKSQFQETSSVSVTTIFLEAETSDWMRIELLGRMHSKTVLPKLLKFLESQNPETVERTVDWLGFLGYTETAPILLEVLSKLDRWIPRGDGSQQLSYNALSLETKIINSLERLSQESAISKLREIFHEPFTFLFAFQMPKINHLLASIDPEYSIDQALKTLEENNDPNQISQALEILSISKHLECLPKIIYRLNCENNLFIQKELVQVLGKFNSKKSTSYLVSLIKNNNSSIQEAVKTLIKHKLVDAVDELSLHLDESDWLIKWSSAIVLGEFQSKDALPTLLEGLASEKHRNIRITAARLLSKYERFDVINILESSLKDSDYAVRRSAAISLAKLNQKSAIPELKKALKHYYPSDELSVKSRVFRKVYEEYGVVIQGMTEESIKSLGNERAIQAWICENNAVGIKEEVADALGQFDTDEVIDSLFTSLDSGFKAAALPLAKLGKQEVLPTLIELLKDCSYISSSDKVIDSLTHLISLGNLLIIPELISILNNISEHRSLDPLFWNRVAIVLMKVHYKIIDKYIPDLYKLLPTEAGKQASWVLESIQSRCGFYNYDITQSFPPELSTRTQNGGNQYIINSPKTQIFEKIDQYSENNTLTS
jgi:HEAT repeat protein